MSVDDGVTDPTRSAVVSLRDVREDEAHTWDDGSSSSSSEQLEDCAATSTRNVSQISTGVLQLGGTPSNIHMENSSDVHIGSRLNYNAPVTINQCVHVLRNNDVIQDGGLLREAIRGPVHVLDSKDTTSSQATLINLHKRIERTSTLYEESSQLPTDVATTCDKLISFCHHRRVCLAVILLPLMMTILVTFVVYFTYNSGNNVTKNTFYPPPEDPDPNPNTTLRGGHRIYSKENWAGQPPRYEKPLQHPTPFVVISHTATDACFSRVDCAAQMRSFQDAHMGKLDMPDIGYSFVVGGDGNVYEGRGWDVTNMHTGFVKRCNIGIAFIGNFIYDTPTNGQIEAVHELIELGVRLEKVAEDYKLVSMNETYNTLSPGVVVYNIISQWPHFWRPTDIILTIARLSKLCIIRITNDFIYLIIVEENVTVGKPMVWGVMEQTHFFNEYNMAGVSEEQNEIYLEFETDVMARSLSSLRVSHGARSVKMKLTNKREPCLTFEIQLSELSNSRFCVHDIPVTVVPRRDWTALQEPLIPNYDVSIQLPSLKLLRTVAERMKALSSYIVLLANHEGTLILKVETPDATVSTHFKDLTVERTGGHEDNSDEFFSARVDIKKFVQFLMSEQVNPVKVVCNIVDDRMLALFLGHEDITLHCFLPAVSP